MRPERKPLRLAGYDYASPGVTFVTVCLSPRLPLLGTVTDEAVELSDTGATVRDALEEACTRFAGMEIDALCVMPDHVHALFVNGEGAISVSTVVGSFKSLAARRVNERRRTPGAPFWQRGFHDHVIRDEPDLERHRAYILTNPTRWRDRHGLGP